MGLPTLSPGWTYACSTDENYRKTNGAGWIPIDLDSSSISALSSLPVDPKNTVSSGAYYSYVADSDSYVITTLLESEKLLKEVAADDNGVDYGRYELGSDIDLWRDALGIVGWWKLDDAAGSVADDSSFNGNDGVLLGNPTWVSGKLGGALRFIEAGSYVSVPYSTTWSGSFPAYSIGFWVRPIVNTSYDVSISIGPWDGEINIYRHELNQWGFFVGTNDEQDGWECRGVTPLLDYLDTPDEKFHYIMLSVDALEKGDSGRCRFYSDGALIETDEWVDGTTDFGNENLRFGDGGTNQLQGDLDDIRLYQRAFSPADVQSTYKALQ